MEKSTEILVLLGEGRLASFGRYYDSLWLCSIFFTMRKARNEEQKRKLEKQSKLFNETLCPLFYYNIIPFYVKCQVICQMMSVCSF